MHSSGFWAQYLGKIGSAFRPNSISRFRNIAMRLNTSFGTSSRSWKSAGSVHSLQENQLICFRISQMYTKWIFTFRPMLRHVAIIGCPKCFHPLVQSTYTLHHPKSMRNGKLVEEFTRGKPFVEFYRIFRILWNFWLELTCFDFAASTCKCSHGRWLYMCCHVLYGEHAPSPVNVSWIWANLKEKKRKKTFTWRRSPTTKAAI